MAPAILAPPTLCHSDIGNIWLFRQFAAKQQEFAVSDNVLHRGPLPADTPEKIIGAAFPGSPMFLTKFYIDRNLRRSRRDRIRMLSGVQTTGAKEFHCRTLYLLNEYFPILYTPLRALILSQRLPDQVRQLLQRRPFCHRGGVFFA